MEVGKLCMGSGNCRRPLGNTNEVDCFVRNILKIPRQDRSEVVPKILQAEIALEKLESHHTSSFEDYRSLEYMTEESRHDLRKKILSELISYECLENDDDITLGKGGAKPAMTQSDALAYIVSGAPASGKSSVADRLARENGAYILDSDYAKRKFPEFRSFFGGASLVHKESDSIILDPKDSLLEYCIYSRHNVVIPMVGKTFESVETICKRLIKSGYKIHIINIALDRYKCALRAYKRYVSSERYVPLSYVFDEVGNEPERIYYLLKRAYESDENFLSFSQVSTDVNPGELPIIVERTENSPIKGWAEVE